MADDTFEYITTDFMVSIDSDTSNIQPIEYIIELGEQGIPGVQGPQGEPGYSPVVNYTWNNDTIQFTLVNRDYTETTPNLYDYVLRKDGSNASNPITLNHLTVGYQSGSPYINSDRNLYIRGDIISLQPTLNAQYKGNEIATVNNIGNGTITLTQGGVTKGTFTTNQSGNTTIELDAGSSITNPLSIGYNDGEKARALRLGIDTSNDKIISEYFLTIGSLPGTTPIYFLKNVTAPLVGTINSLGAIDLSINTMVGTDGTTDGITGTVPAPLTTDTGKYLRADGTWATPSEGGGGTSDYTELTNKPQINSVTLTSNKTSSDLGLQNELTQGTGISIVNDTISIDNTVALKTDIPSLTGYATQQWVTNQGYLTSISSSDVVTALGYTPYSASNPNGYTNNVGTVTSVNNTQPDANGNVSINIPDVSNYVDLTTTQTISGIKTFTNPIHTDIIQNVNGTTNLFSYANNRVNIGTPTGTLYLYGDTLRPRYYYNGNTQLALLSDIPTVPITDQTYDSTSTNPQSGTAVAEAIVSATSSNYIEAHKAYLADADLLTDSQGLEYVKYYNHSTFDLFKFTVVGSPTITADGIVSGFSSSNYLRLPNSILANIFPKKKWKIQTGIVTVTEQTTDRGILFISGHYSCILQIHKNRYLYLSMSSNGSTFDIANSSISSRQYEYNKPYIFTLERDENGYFVKMFDINANQEYTILTISSTADVYVDSDISFPKIGYDSWYSAIGNTSIDLKQFLITADGVEVFSGNRTGIDTYTINGNTLTIPYTLSKTGSKIVDSLYRVEVQTVYDQYGYAPYYTLSNTDFTLPMGELYGMIGQRALRDTYRNGIFYYDLYSDRTLEQGGSCTSGTAVTFLKPFVDTNYVLTVPYSVKTTTGFTPSQTGDWIAKGVSA